MFWEWQEQIKICEFEASTVVFQRIQVMWDVTLCHCVSFYKISKNVSAFLTSGATNQVTQFHISKDLHFIHREINELIKFRKCWLPLHSEYFVFLTVFHKHKD